MLSFSEIIIRLTAEASFHEGAEVRAVLLSERPSLNTAADGVVALETCVLGHVSFEHLTTKEILGESTKRQ
jgi:hypothetical protein